MIEASSSSIVVSAIVVIVDIVVVVVVADVVLVIIVVRRLRHCCCQRQGREVMVDARFLRKSSKRCFEDLKIDREQKRQIMQIERI